ncbi:FUN14 domain-containing protein [Ceratobasidium sp. AG-Ba]|nr:FUN14 domain-containing protein [Ceratobasidium sp. AG-Ba]
MHLFKKSTHVFASACRLSRQSNLPTRSFASAAPRLHSLSIESPLVPRYKNSTQPRSFGIGGIAAASVGLGLAAFAGRKVYCEGSVSPSRGPAASTNQPRFGSDPLPPPPESSLGLYQLTFGSVAGICAGVFIKKGARAIAFFLGGIFVLLQYFNAIDITKVNWGSASTRFERLFYSSEPGGKSRAPTIGSLWAWLVDFLTADFPPRATFLAGLILGLRVG